MIKRNDAFFLFSNTYQIKNHIFYYLDIRYIGGIIMYKLQELPYLFQDFEPFIDTNIMGLHYHKHQQ